MLAIANPDVLARLSYIFEDKFSGRALVDRALEFYAGEQRASLWRAGDWAGGDVPKPESHREEICYLVSGMRDQLRQALIDGDYAASGFDGAHKVKLQPARFQNPQVNLDERRNTVTLSNGTLVTDIDLRPRSVGK